MCSDETNTNLKFGFKDTKQTLPLTVAKAIVFSSGDICARCIAPSYRKIRAVILNYLTILKYYI